MSESKADTLLRTRRFLEDSAGASRLEDLIGLYRTKTAEFRSTVNSMQDSIDNVFSFLDDVYPDSQEILIFVTELTVNPSVSSFISHYDSPSYFRHSKELMFHERNKELIRKLEQLEL